MLHEYYSNKTVFGKHLCSKPAYLKDHIFWAAVLFPDNQAPAPEVTLLLCRQPSDPTAVSTWTIQHNDPVGAAGHCRAALWSPWQPSPAAVNLSAAFIGHLASGQWAVLGTDLWFFPGGKEICMGRPCTEWKALLPSQSLSIILHNFLIVTILVHL